MQLVIQSIAYLIVAGALTLAIMIVAAVALGVIQ